jgi:hypothetical protein
MGSARAPEILPLRKSSRNRPTHAEFTQVRLIARNILSSDNLQQIDFPVWNPVRIAAHSGTRLQQPSNSFRQLILFLYLFQTLHYFTLQWRSQGGSWPRMVSKKMSVERICRICVNYGQCRISFIKVRYHANNVCRTCSCSDFRNLGPITYCCHDRAFIFDLAIFTYLSIQGTLFRLIYLLAWRHCS